MADATWAGGTLLTWGDGRAQTVDTWGNPLNIPVVDSPTPLSDLAIPYKNNPRKVWAQQPSLRKVVDFVATKISAVPLHVYVRVSDTDRQRDRDGKAETLLRSPSPFVSGVSLMHDLIVDWMLYDRFLLIRDGDELVRVPAGLINVKTDFLGGITQLLVRSPDGLVDVTDADIAYSQGWSGDSGGGISPMRTLSETLEEQRRAVQWRGEQWERAARVSGVLTSPKKMHQQNVDRLLQSWRAYRDSKAGGTPLLEDGVEFKKIDSPRPVDTQDLEGRKLTDAEVASFYGIPPELVGARQGTFANIRAFREMLYGPTLGPLMSRIEAALNSRIIPALSPPGSYVEFNREGAMAGSFDEQAAYLQKIVGAPVMSRAEGRARLNLPYLDGTDELIVPKNVTEGGLASPADTDPTQGAPEWGA